MRNMSAWFICRCRNSSVKLLKTCTKNISRKDVLLIHTNLTRKTCCMIVLKCCFLVFVILFPGRAVSYKFYSYTLSNLVLPPWWLLKNALQHWFNTKWQLVPSKQWALLVQLLALSMSQYHLTNLVLPILTIFSIFPYCPTCLLSPRCSAASACDAKTKRNLGVERKTKIPRFIQLS